MRKPRVYRVRHTKVWEDEFVALSREEALEQSGEYHAVEGYLAENSNTTTARVLREATDEETKDYYNDTLQDEDSSYGE